MLSAFCLRDTDTPLARALLADAVARTRTLAPGGAVAPRRPKGLPALAIGALVLAAAAVAPVRSRAARVPMATPAAPGAPLASGVLDVEREAARRAAADAAALHDDRLATLAGELQRTLRRLAAGDAERRRRAGEAGRPAAPGGGGRGAGGARRAGVRGREEGARRGDGDARRG